MSGRQGLNDQVGELGRGVLVSSEDQRTGWQVVAGRYAALDVTVPELASGRVGRRVVFDQDARVDAPAQLGWATASALCLTRAALTKVITG